MSTVLRFLNLGLLMLVVTGLAHPQSSSSTAELRGTITDQAGAVVSKATVTLTELTKGTVRTFVTDDSGQYAFLALTPSEYELKVNAANARFDTFIRRITLTVGEQSNLAVQLTPNGLAELVNIVDGTEVIQTDRTEQSSIVNNKHIVMLPLNRRNYLDFALLTPGVIDSDSIADSSDFRVAQRPQSGLSFGGNNGRLNSIKVDGGEITDSGGGVIQPVSQEAVQEFQVLRNSFNAEFGNVTGGIVNIISKTGSNAVRGSVFGLFRDERFDARNSFDRNPSGKSAFGRQQVGGSLGFPIKKNKTFLFVALEHLGENDSAFVNLVQNPRIFQVTASQKALLDFLETDDRFASAASQLRNALTTTNQNYPRTVALLEDASGQFPFHNRETSFSTRLDHTFNARDNAYARFSVSSQRLENRAAGALTAVSRGRTLDSFNTSILVSETHTFSNNAVNELKLQFVRNRFDVIPNDPIGPEINIEGFGNFGRDIFLPARRYERHYDVFDNFTLALGDHTLKFGASTSILTTTTVQELFFGGRFNFGANVPLSTAISLTVGPQTLANINSFVAANRPSLLPNLSTAINALQAYNFNLPSVYQQGFGNSQTNASAVRNGVYVQDTWRVRPNLTLNYGLRYSLNNEPFPIPTDKTNFQPRVGFAYAPTSDRRTVIRGGFGIFSGYVINAVPNAVRTLGAFGDETEIGIVLSTPTASALGLPTSSAIYQFLFARTNGFSRTATAEDLAALGVVPHPGAPLEVRFRLDPNYKTPESYQGSFGVERDIGYGFSVELAYLFSRGIHIPRSRDINQFKQTGPPNPLNPLGGPTFIRFPTAAQIAAGLTSDFHNPARFQDNQYESSANSFYHGVTVAVTRNVARNFTLNVHYTYSKAIDEVTDFNSDFSAQNPLNTRADRALSAFDQRHRAVFSGTIWSPVKGDSLFAKVFRDVYVSPIFIAASGRPFNLLLGFDANNDGRSQTDRPGTVGRNTGLGEPYYSLDARLARQFKFGESKFLEITIEGFNLFNRNNLQGINNIVGGLPLAVRNALANGTVRGDHSKSPTEPLGFTSAANARQLQFGVRLNF